jgi:hypothetical protein
MVKNHFVRLHNVENTVASLLIYEQYIYICTQYCIDAVMNLGQGKPV